LLRRWNDAGAGAENVVFAFQQSLPKLFEASRAGRLTLADYDAAMVVSKHTHTHTRIQLRRPLA